MRNAGAKLEDAIFGKTMIRSPQGAKRRSVQLSKIQIPDLWHIAMRAEGKEREMILECWHLCHDMLANLRGDI